ncbi:UNKNOWN [Stylonychia lemnae]|uniref:C2HC/C3H-type domain-containing protein n=1 Tax=Stylonychia lemnae TaxID=5949 RepID=A0A078A3V3_STYLE|nr:UNKNOWN [Stylonychia lemnae]|eukprot:CDW76549.1 UNKNOWN [Stylonychia lemnae]
MTSDKLEEYNNDAFKNYNEKALEPCQNCGRTFLPDRLIVHLKSCKGNLEQKPSVGKIKASSGQGDGDSGKFAQSMKSQSPGDIIQQQKIAGGKGGGLSSSQSANQFKSPELSQTFKKPKTLVCYICGREFGTSSLEIHIKSCAKKWEIEQSQKPKHERKPLPQAPQNFDQMLGGSLSQEDLEQYNQSAMKEFNEKGMDQCPNCGRTFLPDRLIVHLRSCNKAHGVKETQQSPQKSLGSSMGGGPGSSMGGGPGSPKQIVKPKTLVCYICGREFGSASLEIHLKTCKQKWENEQAQKPKHERKPIPQPPKNFDDMLAGKVSGEKLEQYNDNALKEYNDKALDRCPNCGRTFIPDRLVVHLRSCNKAHGKSPDEGPKGGMSSSGGMNSNSSPSKEIHIKSCKQKWEIEESKKPPKERRPVPDAPKSFDEVVIGAKSGQGADIQQYNEDAFKQYNEVSLVPCHNCGRTFLPDRLQIHLKSCDKAHHSQKKGGEDVSKSTSSLSESFKSQGQNASLSTPDLRNKAINGQDSSSCNLCGRSFSQNLMENHLKSCQKRWSASDKLNALNQ